MYMKSKIGFVFAGVYVTIAVYLIATQGLFGESFIALILGMPWTLVLAFFEFFGATGVVGQVLLILPMTLNAYLLFLLGNTIGKQFSKEV
jgi:hypothetical protein